MNIRRRNDFDKKDINLLPKNTLIKLILNKSSESLQPNPVSLDVKQNINIRGQELMAQEEEVVGFDTQLDRYWSLNRRLNQEQRDNLIQAHLKLQITDSNRKQFLLLLSGAHHSLKLNPTYYQLLLSSIPNYPCPLFSQIQKDVTRTFKSHCPSQLPLNNILRAYAVRNPRLTYCQGMNYLVAYFLMNNFTEEETFWMLSELIEGHLPWDYYVEMGSVVVLSRVVVEVVAEVMPGFREMCEGLGVETSSFLVTWLVCLFTKGFASAMANYAMANVIVEKEVGLVKSAIALLKIAVPRIVEVEDYQSFVKELEVAVMSVSVKEFKLVYDSLYVNRSYFLILFERYLKDYQQSTRSPLSNPKKHTLPTCQNHLPVCLHFIQINRQVCISEVSTMRIKPNLDTLIDPTHFSSIRPIHPSSSSSSSSSSTSTCSPPKTIDNLLLGRHPHICHQNDIRGRVSQYEIIDEDFKMEEISTGSQLDSFQQKALRKTEHQRIAEVTSAFEVVENWRSQEFDVLEYVEERGKCRGSKPIQNPEIFKQRSVINWIKRLF